MKGTPGAATRFIGNHIPTLGLGRGDMTLNIFWELAGSSLSEGCQAGS